MKPTSLRIGRKVCISEKMDDEVLREARRLDRNASWLIELAWKLALEKIKSIPD